ncbi:hypothetical protein J4E85_009661 [Alternaria conjuncta]|uniref:uncharacterized protein n=1 Tax=Alternaria conjuncta TaxID=181017 RepID=UPI00221E5811|nr:uncharacterized protein J4E85_009661 [Alternaria conjuncta]KAI4918872.1 hypothetical protein J4E85_009661 [Alternaria conjuncta]
MATLDTLERALKRVANTKTSVNSPREPLTDEQYAAGFETFVQGPGWAIYRDFIIPELSYLLSPLHQSDKLISVLEIGPGPESVLGHLHRSLRERIGKYNAFEPKVLYALKLEDWLQDHEKTDTTSRAPFPCLESDPIIYASKREDWLRDHEKTDTTSKAPFPCLESNPVIYHTPFDPDGDTPGGADIEKYDIVLFCHSMYGMKPQDRFIKHALNMLLDNGIVAVFRRDGIFHIDGLACHHTASYPTGVVGVADNDDALGIFAPFVAGFTMQDTEEGNAVLADWRKLCRDLARRDDVYPETLLFSAPEVMLSFNQHADKVEELKTRIGPILEEKLVKNKQALVQRPAAIVRPDTVEKVQKCVKWALEHSLGLTIVGGGHSAHCLKSNVVAIDMSAFDSVHVLKKVGDVEDQDVAFTSLVVAGAGCKTVNIISKTLKEGLTVPLGSRPSVGAGLWLQGGIGHLTRIHGLTCDNIVGAVLISVASGEIFYVGRVPSDYVPKEGFRPDNDTDILWALKGAGTNFGIVLSVILRAYPAQSFATRNWVIPLSDNAEAERRLREFDEKVAKGCSNFCSADAYLYCEDGQLNLGITTFASIDASSPSPMTIMSKRKGDLWGTDSDNKIMDGVEVFDAEMYMSKMHGGHGDGKTSSFKRCVFLKDIGKSKIAQRLVSAVESRPSPFCYLHLLHGGGKAGEVAPEATAFGCRDWDFACVVTGVWPRDEDGNRDAHASVQWVYDVVDSLLPLSTGTYGADLGPDPRDAVLAEKAFGPNTVRLGRHKRLMDPRNVLAWACPLPKPPLPKPPLPKLIILVTGEHGAGKDYCAGEWVAVFSELNGNASSSTHGLRAQAIRISDVTKREFADATGNDFRRLLDDRAYKDQHRPALTAFYEKQIQERPRLPEEHFLEVVHNAASADVDVLFITGMRDEAPVTSFSHLVAARRVIEVRVDINEASRVARGVRTEKTTDLTAPRHRPNLTFVNDTPGNGAIREFAEASILPFVHNDLQRLADMVRSIPNFPKPGIQFRHVLGISQQPGGLALCASLLQSHFTGCWANVDAIVCCEVGGLVFAPALASLVDVPLVPIREAGKLPPPTISVMKNASYISSQAPNQAKIGKRIVIGRNAIIGSDSVVVVDDVLSTGETLCAVLHLLKKAGVKSIAVMVVAEFPLHCGRKLLYDRGHGMVDVQSLLVLGGD